MRFTTLLFCMAVAFAAAAQDYPAKPVKMLVPYAPGGATDIIARIVAQRLTESLKESFIVENRPGANGNIALEATAKAPADGYTLLVGNVSTNAINDVRALAADLSIALEAPGTRIELPESPEQPGAKTASVIVAVNVTDAPEQDGLTEEATAVVVLAFVTVRVPLA